MANPEGPYVKVHFRLETEDDWPPASVESLWAVDQGDGTSRLDNIPWFVRGIACGDIVAIESDGRARDGPARWFGVPRTAPSASSCSVTAALELRGRERFGMVALDVPPTADLAKVQKLLDHGVAKEWWDMEEGCVTAQWRAASAG
ncbi:DUF4265 domain-containing protein [Streptomyces olivaceoviridis]